MHHSKRSFWLTILFSVCVVAIAIPAPKWAPAWWKSIDQKLSINLGLDLQGGLHLEYALDTSKIAPEKVREAEHAVQAVVERRVNAYGVGEPIVQLAHRGEDSFLIVEFPGAKNIDDIKNVIQKTPFLEFREPKSEDAMEEERQALAQVVAPMNEEAQQQAQDLLTRVQNGEDFSALAKEFSKDTSNSEEGGVLDFVKKGAYVPEFDAALFADDLQDGQVVDHLVETQFGWHIVKKMETRGEGDDREIKAQHILIGKLDPPVDQFTATELTGEYLEQSQLNLGNQYGGGLSEPEVLLQFDSTGAKMFADITKRNLGKQVAIYLDNEIVSAPTVQAEITDGRAVISGNFTVQEAKDLAARLNEGALPVPIELVSQNSVEATLGQVALQKSLYAGIIGLLCMMLFMIAYYRFYGLIASMALIVYTATVVTIIRLSTFTPMSITLTLAGIAGLILSIGMAVDANILIFERLREELRRGKPLQRAITEGFARAWTSIRDGNYSTILTSLVLMTMGTGFVKGFAIILILGVLTSMFTAIILVRIVVVHVSGPWLARYPWLIGGGYSGDNHDKK